MMQTTRQLLLTVGPDSADLPGFTHFAVQAALDQVAALGGGTVRLLAGTYTLRNAVRLRRGVRLEGAGDDTHLVKAAEVSSPLDDDSDWYDDQVSVADPAGFHVGDGIVLQGADPHGGPDGLHRTKRTVVAIEGHRLYLDEGLNKNYWALTHAATASTLFPLLWGEATCDLEVAELRLDGNRAANSLLDGNHAGCIFLQYVERVHLTGITAHDYHGDGISWQVANDVHVLGCHVHDNVNLGLHPGSGSQRPLMLENHCHHNSQGLFFCWGVRHGVAEGNVLEDNRDYGISIGHRDTDNRIAGNTVRRNAQVGVYFRAEEPAARLPHRNQLVGNTIADNGAAADGVGLWLRDRVEGTVVRGNRFSDGGAGAQRVGILIEPEVVDVTVENNRFDGLQIDVDDRRP